MKKITFRPLRAEVLIKLHDVEQTTKSGIILPDSIKDKPLTGTVIAVGPGTSKMDMEVAPGDVILFNQYSGNEVEIDGEKYIRQLQANILGILIDTKDEN